LQRATKKEANAHTAASVLAALPCLTAALPGSHLEASEQKSSLRIAGKGCF